MFQGPSDLGVAGQADETDGELAEQGHAVGDGAEVGNVLPALSSMRQDYRYPPAHPKMIVVPRKASPAGFSGTVILVVAGCCGYALFTTEMPWDQKLLLAFGGTLGLLLAWGRVSGGK